MMSEENSDGKSTEKSSESLLETVSDAEVNSRISFEEFTDERTLIFYEFKVKWDYFLDFDFFLGFSFPSNSFLIAAALLSTALIIF